MAKKELTEFTIRCQCGAAAPIFPEDLHSLFRDNMFFNYI
jgi:hypothetical protein